MASLVVEPWETPMCFHRGHGTLLDEDAHVVGAVRVSEVPALLALVGNRVRGADEIERVVVNERATSLGRDVGELDEVLVLGVLIGNVEDLGSNLVAQVNLHALVLARGGVEQAIAHDVLLDAALELAAVLDGLDLGAGVRAGAAATADKAEAGDGCRRNAHGSDELTTGETAHGETPFVLVTQSVWEEPPARRAYRREVPSGGSC